jgi:hypothetical protein
MSILDAWLMGEPRRLDYVIREHEKLRRQVETLTELLVARGVIPRDALRQPGSEVPADTADDTA